MLFFENVRKRNRNIILCFLPVVYKHLEDTNTLSSVDRQMLRDEFLRTMQVRFLNGEDSEHFDYR